LGEQTCDAEGEPNSVVVAARGDAVRQSNAIKGFNYPGNWLELAPPCIFYTFAVSPEKVFGWWGSQLVSQYRDDRGPGAPHIASNGLLGCCGNTQLCHQGREKPVRDDLGIHQHTIAIEDHPRSHHPILEAGVFEPSSVRKIRRISLTSADLLIPDDFAHI
jgi:hypothetical protein